MRGHIEDRVTQYMIFTHMPDDHKTERWVVLNKSDGSTLANISWYWPWRQYCFFPAEGCVFNHGCLHTITAFMVERQKIHGVKA